MITVKQNSAYKQKIAELLSEKRYQHSLNVADTAKALAKQYGADGEKAYIAGLLHDCMKESPREVQLQIIQQSDTILNNAEQLNPSLWHAISGAIYAEKVLGVHDKDILNAIRYHTTAKEECTLLEKCVFVADFISADRTYNGVEEMRLFAQQDIDKAMLEGLRFTIETLAAKEKPLHPDSVLAYNALLMQKHIGKEK